MKPREFFTRLARAFGARARLFLGRHAGRTIAAVLVIEDGSYAVFADGSSLEEAWRLCPNNLVVWTAARECFERGARLLDYGLTALDDGGGARFKTHLGGVATPVYVVSA